MQSKGEHLTMSDRMVTGKPEHIIPVLFGVVLKDTALGGDKYRMVPGKFVTFPEFKDSLYGHAVKDTSLKLDRPLAEYGLGDLIVTLHDSRTGESNRNRQEFLAWLFRLATTAPTNYVEFQHIQAAIADFENSRILMTFDVSLPFTSAATGETCVRTSVTMLSVYGVMQRDLNMTLSEANPILAVKELSLLLNEALVELIGARAGKDVLKQLESHWRLLLSPNEAIAA